MPHISNIYLRVDLLIAVKEIKISCGFFKTFIIRLKPYYKVTIISEE